MNVPKMQIRWLVGRIHVSTTKTDIVKDFYQRFRHTMMDGPKHRRFRKACYREALKAHDKNLREYIQVMAGVI